MTPCNNQRVAPTHDELQQLHIEVGAYCIRGPTQSRPLVEAWCAEHVRFDNRPAWQEPLRLQLRERLRQLAAQPGQRLAATILGTKKPRSDVENLAFYNIDDSGRAYSGTADTAVEFELGIECPPDPSNNGFTRAYRYELRTGTEFRYWPTRRVLARFNEVDLGAVQRPQEAGQVWLALSRYGIATSSPPRVQTAPFALTLCSTDRLQGAQACRS